MRFRATKRQLREALETLAADVSYPPRTPDGWWPLGDDDPEFRRGSMLEETWWRGRIERVLRTARISVPVHLFKDPSESAS